MRISTDSNFVNFLVQNKEKIGEKLLNYPEKWFISKENLPPQYQSEVTPGDAGVLLLSLFDDKWKLIL